jgi:hypothetical protein
VDTFGIFFVKIRFFLGTESNGQMLSDFSAFLGVVSSHIPANVIPTLVDILNGVMIFADAYVIRTLL